MEQDFKNIIRDAIQAPSGENSQPWTFKIIGSTIQLFNMPDRDTSLYNRGQRGSFIAHGALLENINISAAHYNYLTEIILFPENNNQKHVADILLKKGSDIKSPYLYESINNRVTNRKPYRDMPISNNELAKLTEGVVAPNIQILLTQKNEDKKILAKAGGVNESVMMNNKFLHNFFFSHVTWTKEEDNKKKLGFFIDTLELPPPAKKMFKMVKNWKMANLLNKIGLYKMVGAQNAKTYASSSGFGILTTKDISPIGLIEVGMILEQIWLRATNMGLSFQPVSGMLFLRQAIISNEASEFTNAQRLHIEQAYKSIENVFSTKDDEYVVFMFRFGHADKPTAKSSRFNVDEVIQQI